MDLNKSPNNYNKLNNFEIQVIKFKATEPPFTGKYNDFDEKGIYVCRQCGEALYFSDDKFNSSCGWPSFDDEIPEKVKHQPDADGRRTEILCNKCGGHLGHIFKGENYTPKNVRHCVNSVSLDFISADDISNKYKTAYFGGGCFWGVQYYLDEINGVLFTEAGYSGGNTENPTYEQVCSDTTNHAEVVKVVYNPEIVSYNDLLTIFFEIHNPTQLNRQGVDIGSQYRSIILFTDEEQKNIAELKLAGMISSDIDVKTEIIKFEKFFKAEEYHQYYYAKQGIYPQCEH